MNPSASLILAALVLAVSQAVAQGQLPAGEPARVKAQLCTLAFDGTDLRMIHETTNHIEAPNWSPDGKWLVFNGSGALWRVPADGSAPPEKIPTGGVRGINNDHILSPDGQTIYFSARGHIYAVPFTGGEPRRVSNEHPPEKPFSYWLHGISPDGKTLAYTGAFAVGANRFGVLDICTIPAQGGADVNLTKDATNDDGPEFSPDGQWIYFNSERAAKQPGHAQIFRMKPDGSGIAQLTHDERVNWFPHPSPDGKWVVYLSFPPGTTGHPANKDVILRRMKPDGGDTRDLLAFNGGQGTINVPSWSPDSRRFAFVMYPRAGTDLAVSQNGRHIVHRGSPFLWIGDTAWHLADTVGREDIRFYLDERQRSGFTVIQAAVFMGHRQPIGQTRNPANAYGHRPFSGDDEPDTARPLVVAGGDADAPNDYWDHVDFIVREVRQRGLHLALLPCWGSQHVNGRARGGKAVIFNETSARAYGVFLGARYRLEPHLIWVLGGDINPDDKSDQRAVYRAMAEGLVTGVTGESPAWNQPHPAWDRLLMTYHPIGPHSSSEFFHGDAWLDFHMIQTFKYRDRTVDLVARDVALRNPVRPVVMGEPAYEGDADDPYAATSSALDVRRQAWQSFLSGACGFTYGALKSGPHGPLYAFAPGWKECLKLPGAAQVAGPLRQVLVAHAWADWQPDTSVFAGGAGAKELTYAAARASDGRTLLAYFPENAAKKITLTGLKSARCTATWINPQDSARTSAGEYDTQSQQSFTPPVGWPDALLLITAAAATLPQLDYSGGAESK